METAPTFSAFTGDRRVAAGPLEPLLRAVKEQFDREPSALLLIFEDGTGRQVDFDLRGTIDEVLARAKPPARSGPGRPKLGVVSREVSMLPRHWEWLEQQPNGISAALRRLVEEAKKRDPDGERARLAIEATSRFMTAMAGNLPDFEEASRALFAKDFARFDAFIEPWPVDIRFHLRDLLGPARR
ncbi:MAG: hypothetical protein JWP87_1059 [Labilithrix sp.]|nr:hypothetical protein [Labilithrix sp.]